MRKEDRTQDSRYFEKKLMPADPIYVDVYGIPHIFINKIKAHEKHYLDNNEDNYIWKKLTLCFLKTRII